jgi:hypothetical protein
MDLPMWGRIYSSLWQNFCKQQHPQHRLCEKWPRSGGWLRSDAEKSILLSEKCKFVFFSCLPYIQVFPKKISHAELFAKDAIF